MLIQLYGPQKGLLVLHDLSIRVLLFLMLTYHLSFLLLVLDVIVKEIYIQPGL